MRHRARYAPTRRSLAERHGFAEQAERELASMRAAVASGNPAAILAAATRASAAVEAVMLATGRPARSGRPPDRDPWTVSRSAVP